MIRPALVVLAFGSVLFFPTPISLGVTLLASFVSPIAPLALGIFVDLLYRPPHASLFPLYSFFGLILALFSYGVRRFIETSIIK